MGCIFEGLELQNAIDPDEIALARGLLEVRGTEMLSRLPWARGNVKIKFRVIFYKGHYHIFYL